jgi:DNA-binding protein H-NS
MQQIGKIKRVDQENGKLIFKNEIQYAAPDPTGTLENAIAAGEVDSAEAAEYQKQLVIAALHEEIHEIHMSVKSLKARAEQIKDMLKQFGVDPNNILQRPIPPRPAPPKKKPQTTPPATGSGNGQGKPTA